MTTRNKPSFSDQREQSNKTSNKKNKRKFAVKHMQRTESTFLDMNYWKREEVCCGIIFRNKTNDMVLIDQKLFNPCKCRKKRDEERRQSEAKFQKVENELNEEELKINEMEVEINSQSNRLNESTDTNNNLLSSLQTEKINLNLDELNDQLNEDPINELVVVNINSSSGISSDSSDICSITEGDEDSNSSSNNHLISDHNLIAKIANNRTFGVL